MLYKYLVFLTLASVFVIIVNQLFLVYNYVDLLRVSTVSALIIGQTFFACIHAYLEMHYGRENKNIIRLYLAIFSGTVFIVLLMVLNMNFLERISIAMFVSTFATLLLSIFVLYRRNYKLA
jgi:ABC-type amino acid transport system permease subunit